MNMTLVGFTSTLLLQKKKKKNLRSKIVTVYLSFEVVKTFVIKSAIVCFVWQRRQLRVDQYKEQ